MIDASNHVELNGVKYRLAEDAEGQHYVLGGETLRPPNALTVQGETGQKFQVRPDILIWSLTDWSGGEGQWKFDLQNPNRWWELSGVDVFETPGTLRAGPAVFTANHATETMEAGWMAGVWIFSHASTKIYKYNEDAPEWVTSGLTQGSAGDVDGRPDYDSEAAYAVEDTTVYSYNGSKTTLSSGDLDAAVAGYGVASLGDYVYAYDPRITKVWEIAKTPTTVSVIDQWSGAPDHVMSSQHICEAGGRIYVLMEYDNTTKVREITPTTAAAVGFGAEVLSIPGFQANAIYSHSGTVFLPGSVSPDVDGDSSERAIFYYTPGGAYGTLGRWRKGTTFAPEIGVGNSSNRVLDHYIGVANIHNTTDNGIFQIDAVSGGYALLVRNEDSADNDGFITAMAAVDGTLTFAEEGTGNRISAFTFGDTGGEGEVISGWHDFSIADEKILSSLVLSCDEMPANRTVAVDYALDGDTSWTSALSYSTTSGTGTKHIISTDASSKTFRTIRIRISITGTGDSPVINAVDVIAQVALPQRTWRLMLDCSDDHSDRGSESLSGAQKIANVESLGESNAVVDFKDGYQSREPSDFEQVDVLVDQYSVNLDRAGEGVAQVVLREIA